ncbi:PREDICTED: uncharacterized protein LOC108760999 [Trachymyrmex cornetzi]|uniref:uncharacterized protein LOC108760999 n=1 Tax=Trachymyrmex cornetzi TaxID=471704 RepID=UPI00084F5F42|nr:PREDICTED: uncharacterized protein LOC108760999 [Trachymyrmex cornetzi]
MLGASEHNAVRRLRSIERRFGKDPIFHQRYLEFMKDYESMGHMELLPKNSDDQAVANYLPHHGVTREESSTTKLRVVFDAFCQTSSERSLNDLLRVGANLQQELMNILLRFRQHNYVIIANISKMFRQIRIRKKDRVLVLLWVRLCHLLFLTWYYRI